MVDNERRGLSRAIAEGLRQVLGSGDRARAREQGRNVVGAISRGRVLDDGLATLFAARRSGPEEERVLCVLAEASLGLEWPALQAVVTPALDRPPGIDGVLDVRHPALTAVVRVVVTDELARGAWREATDAIVDRVRAEIYAAEESPQTERESV
jgi:hypothetical protein